MCLSPPLDPQEVPVYPNIRRRILLLPLEQGSALRSISLLRKGSAKRKGPDRRMLRRNNLRRRERDIAPFAEERKVFVMVKTTSPRSESKKGKKKRRRAHSRRSRGKDSPGSSTASDDFGERKCEKLARQMTKSLARRRRFGISRIRNLMAPLSYS